MIRRAANTGNPLVPRLLLATLAILLLSGHSVGAFHPRAPIRRLYESLLATPNAIEKCLSRGAKEQSVTRWSYPDKEDSSDDNQFGEKSQPPQAFVDDYLEFLDKRYHRLYDEEVKTTFPTFKWLIQGTKDTQEPTQRETENAFYAFGVAGLASKELLQKYHIGRGRNDTNENPTVIETEGRKHNVVSRIRSKAVSLFRPVNAARRQLLRFQDSQARNIMAVVRHTLKTCPIIFLRLWGGSKSLRFILTAWTAVMTLTTRSWTRAGLTKAISSTLVS